MGCFSVWPVPLIPPTHVDPYEEAKHGSERDDENDRSDGACVQVAEGPHQGSPEHAYRRGSLPDGAPLSPLIESTHKQSFGPMLSQVDSLVPSETMLVADKSLAAPPVSSKR
jgi:hypothetical protein